MTFEAYEEHEYDGAPVELYHFDIDGGADYYYTSSETQQTYLSQVYEVQEGLSRSGTKMSGTGKDNEIGVTLPHSHEVPALFKSSLPHAEVKLTIYKKHRDDTEFKFTWQGHVVQCSFSYPEARLACVPLDGQRDNSVLQPKFQHRCNWKIYDTNCGLEFGAWAVTKTVTAMSADSLTLTVGDLSAYAANYFKGGVIRFGSNAHVMIIAHTVTGSNDTVTLFNAMGGLTVGDSIKIAPSCQGSKTTCRDTFSNIENCNAFEIPVRNIFSGDGVKGSY